MTVSYMTYLIYVPSDNQLSKAQAIPGHTQLRMN